MVRPGKKRRRAAKWIWLLLLAGLALTVWILPVFRLQEVELTAELHSLTGAEIIDAAGFWPGDHLAKGLGGSLPLWLDLRYGRAEAAIKEQLPAVKDVTARLKLPGTIQLDITERIEVAWLVIPDGCVMIDKEGVALKIMSQPPAGIPLITGINISSLVLGRPVQTDLPESMDQAISILAAIIEADRDHRPRTSLLAQVSMIRPLSGRQIYLTLQIPASDTEITVLEQAGAELAEDMLWLRFALDQEVLAGQGKGVLDMSGSRTTFIPDP